MFLGVPPPSPSNYRNLQPPPRYEEEIAAAAGSMNTPIVIGLLLSVFLFALCLIFYFSPACMHKERLPKPLDLEDAYFVDENAKRRIPSFGTSSNSYSMFSMPMEQHQKKLNHPKNTYFSFAPPPPAYTSRPGSPTTSFDDWSFSSLLARANSKQSGRRANSTGKFWSFRFFSRFRRTTSTPLPISKPIPLPEEPLPGPEILTDAEIENQTTDTTFIRPCIGKSVSENILHPSAGDLHTPSQAHIYNRDTVSAQNSQYLSASHSRRSSGRLVGTHSQGSISSVTSSMIGIAF